MTGVDIIGSLLRADADVVGLVPLERIKAGLLPDRVPLPALLVRLVSSVERQPLKRGATTRTTDRVSVTVRAASYDDQVNIIRLVKKCCAGRTGDIGGGSSVSILTAGTGPDLIGPAASFEQSQDFRVGFDAGGVAGAPSVTPATIEQMTVSTSDGIAVIGGDIRLDVDGLSDAP